MGQRMWGKWDSRRGEKGHIFWGGILPWAGLKQIRGQRTKWEEDIGIRDQLSVW